MDTSDITEMLQTVSMTLCMYKTHQWNFFSLSVYAGDSETARV